MVWMRTAGLPEFRKLWGRIETQLPAGNYLININNSMLISIQLYLLAYNVSGFDGSKAFVLSTANVFGGRNIFLAYAYIAVGVVCGLIFLGFFVRK